MKKKKFEFKKCKPGTTPTMSGNKGVLVKTKKVWANISVDSVSFEDDRDFVVVPKSDAVKIAKKILECYNEI